ncbi:MAG: efflux transporter outer membrane subunit [Gemmatimonadales bacterium]|nr:efflux transporter outer membrane subunit [Gemmatimonadales bacterium]
MYRAAVVLTSFVLAGCAASPAYHPPEVRLPAAFRETLDSVPHVAGSAAAVSPARPEAVAPDPDEPRDGAGAGDTAIALNTFWRELGDTTLARLMNEAVGGNLDVRAAEARVRGARATRTEVALDLAPTVTFGGGYTRQRLSGATFPIGSGGFPDQDIWDGGFDAAWELDLFGRVRRNVQARGAFVAVAREDLRDVRVSLTAELARAYFDLRGAQEQLLVAQRNAQNQQRTLQVTRQRLEAGRGTAFDTERAQAQLSFTLASVPLLESRVAQAHYLIGILVGRPPTVVAGELAVAASLPALPDVGSLGRPDSIILGRPDVAAAERRLAVERALVGAARAEYLPRLSLGGSAGYSADRFNSLGDRGTFRYAVGPIISWPALNLGRVKARVDVSRAREDEARAQYDQSVLRALQEVEASLALYRTSRARVELIQNAATASERAAELARVRFSGGVADFLEVLDAERTQLEAQDQLAQGRTEAATAFAALYRALGGEWPVSS